MTRKKEMTAEEIENKIKGEVLNTKGHEKGLADNYRANRDAGKSAFDYARPIFDAADKWGRLMQVRMREEGTKTLTKAIVDETAPYFGDWGIWARRPLVYTWVHGKKLGQILGWPDLVIQAQRDYYSNRSVLARQRERE